MIVISVCCSCIYTYIYIYIAMSRWKWFLSNMELVPFFGGHYLDHSRCCGSCQDHALHADAIFQPPSELNASCDCVRSLDFDPHGSIPCFLPCWAKTDSKPILLQVLLHIPVITGAMVDHPPRMPSEH